MTGGQLKWLLGKTAFLLVTTTFLIILIVF